MYTVGKLTRMLTMESEDAGDTANIVIPRGTIVIIETDQDWPNEIKDEDFMKAAVYLKNMDKTDAIMKMLFDKGIDLKLDEIQDIRWMMEHILHGEI